MAQIAFAAVAFAGQAIKAYQKKREKIEETKNIRDAKNRSMAATTREMAEEERKKDFMYSRALAVAGKSGGGLDDAGMVNTLADINAEGEYRVLSKLYAGQNEADGLVYRAEAAEREGEAAITAGWVNGVTSAMSSYSGMSGG